MNNKFPWTMNHEPLSMNYQSLCYLFYLGCVVIFYLVGQLSHNMGA